jgi:signal transduction histidine kinase
MAYYVIACVCGVWLSVSLQESYVPRNALVAMLVATTGGLLLMAPYFGYVFWFLEPMNIIERIRREAVKTAASGSEQASAEASAAAQAATLSAMEELTDITSNSISGKDKIIASGAVDALKDFTLEYLRHKPQASDPWFEIGAGIRQNPDFVAMDPESLQDLVSRRTWVEWKVMRQFLGIYNEALQTMRDINYLVAIDTRYIGEAAARAADRELVQLVFRFMNSYLRATLNVRDVRTAYNVLNQYRLLVEAMLRQKNGEAALEGVQHMNYYGHVSFDMKLTFVTETVAYDVSALCQYAHDVGAPEERAMLDEFLELDRPLRVRAQENALLGVRKAQVKLAAYYLLKGEEERARLIADDMADEPAERLTAIRHALESVTSKDFWEIIDRGRNFEFMPPAQRACLKQFFDWLGIGQSAPPAPVARS